MHKYTLIIGLLLFAFGCKNSTKVKEFDQPVSDEIHLTDSLNIIEDSEILTDSIQIKHIQVGGEDPTAKKKFHASYPSTLYDFINQEEEAFVQAYFQEFKENEIDVGDTAVAGIDFGQHFELIENHARYISFLIERYSSYGNNYDTKFYTHVYDLKAKEQVSFSQLFENQDRFNQFSALARKKAEVEIKHIIDEMQDLTPQDKEMLWTNSQDMFREGIEANDTNYHAFSWDQNGQLKLYMDKYQIASGDFGIIELSFAPGEYSNLINPKYQDLFHVTINEDEKSHSSIPQTYEPRGDIDCGKEPCVAITFDDGPSIYTDGLLDILKENDVKATFFVLGKSAEVQKNTILRTYQEGHQIGNHSWDHKDLKNLSKANIEHQIYDTNNAVKEIIGEAPHVMRPPYGSMNNMVKEIAGMPIILWNLDPLDWKDRDAKIVAERMSKANKNGIVLAHDIHKTTVNAMPAVIKALKDKGYHLVTIDELFAGQELKNGVKYSQRK